MVQPRSIRNILVNGAWEQSSDVGTFQVRSPLTGSQLPALIPISSWDDCERLLEAAHAAFDVLRHAPNSQIGDFLEHYAAAIERHATTIASQAHEESGFPVSPRLLDVELPRTVNQLRQAATAAREGSWRMPTIDSAANVRSYLAGIGPVCVLGPSNFPLAFGSASGGDFAAAIAAGNPVIAKAHPQHPETARLFAELAAEAAAGVGLPSGTVQLLYHLEADDGERLVSDRRIAATAFTGSRRAGLRLKRAAESTGKLIYLELSSINPVVILPGALRERASEIAEEFCNSALMGGGQFCTNPGLVVLIAGEESERFISQIVDLFQSKPAGQLMSAGIVASLKESVTTLREAGAARLAGDPLVDEDGCSHPNTLLRISGTEFIERSEIFQTEAFGNASLLVVAESTAEAARALALLEGNLTGSIYSAADGSEEVDYATLAKILRPRVGRLLNDKMPTGVAVSAAMNHGGPYPATGHPHFTAVGIPASIRRFTMLQCFDGVRQHRLPPLLQDANPTRTWRLVDGHWTEDDLRL